MSAELQQRARAFLKREIPSGIDYVPHSLAENFIATYARRGRLADDDDTAELVGMAGMEASAMADDLKDPAAAEYFRETSNLLEAILSENI